MAYTLFQSGNPAVLAEDQKEHSKEKYSDGRGRPKRWGGDNSYYGGLGRGENYVARMSGFAFPTIQGKGDLEWRGCPGRLLYSLGVGSPAGGSLWVPDSGGASLVPRNGSNVG